MKEIIWKDYWSIGNELIDSQHNELVKLANDLVNSCDDPKKDISKALTFLVDYTVTHFRDEEALQIACGFPEYKRHKQLHDNFKAVVAGFVAQFEQSSGSTWVLKEGLEEILLTWLSNHIEIEDKLIGKHMEQQQASGKKIKIKFPRK